MSIDYLNTIWKVSNQKLKEQNLFREPFPYALSCKQAAILFSSNDYLNLRNDIRIKQAGFEAVLKSGSGTGASRSVLQTDGQIEFLEDFFCKNMDYKHALFLPSGFLANVTFFDVLAPFLSESIDQEIFIDHRAHASLFFAMKAVEIKHFIFRHNDYFFLEKKLSLSKASAKIIVVESLYSMDGDFIDAHALLCLCKKYGALLFIDEGHTFGVYGNKGRGFVHSYPELKPFVIASVFGCGKAVGVSGGFLATNSLALKERVFQKSKTFIYSTGISPFISGAVQKSLEIIFSSEGDKKRQKLQNNMDFLKIKIPYTKSQIIPIIIGSNARALHISQVLFENDIIAKPIRSPSVPRGTERIRITLNSEHSFSHIEKLVNILQSENIYFEAL